jgi:hypothetical protein
MRSAQSAAILTNLFPLVSTFRSTFSSLRNFGRDLKGAKLFELSGAQRMTGANR